MIILIYRLTFLVSTITWGGGGRRYKDEVNKCLKSQWKFVVFPRDVSVWLGPPDVLGLGVPRLRFFCACASAAVTSVTRSGPSDLTQTRTSNISLWGLTVGLQHHWALSEHKVPYSPAWPGETWPVDRRRFLHWILRFQSRPLVFFEHSLRLPTFNPNLPELTLSG